MALSLSAHDRQELEEIEEGLAASDPQLAAMLSTFSRLVDGEAIPAREQIRADKQNRAARQRPAVRVRWVLPTDRRHLLQIAIALWVMMTIVIAIVIVVRLRYSG